MQHHIHASGSNKPGTLVRTTTQRLIMLEHVGPEFRASSEDADVWGLERGGYYQRVDGRDATTEEVEVYEFAQNPNKALWNMVMRRGQAHQQVAEGLLHLANLSHDVFSGTMNLHADGDQLVATSYTHIYDGDDIRRAKALPIAALSADYKLAVAALIARAEKAAAEKDEEWETL